MTRVALVVGASGIAGFAISETLRAAGWTVYGLARSPLTQPGVLPIAADFHDVRSLKMAFRT